VFKRALHALFVYCSVVPWALGCLLFGLALFFTILAHRTLPDTDMGNCWTFLGPRWFKHGGYILVRWADDVRVFGKLRIPHAIHVTHLGEDTTLFQTVPRERSKNKWLPWRTMYFKYRVKTTEKSRDATK
jgi:hypothetical protein